MKTNKSFFRRVPVSYFCPPSLALVVQGEERNFFLLYRILDVEVLGIDKLTKKIYSKSSTKYK